MGHRAGDTATTQATVSKPAVEHPTTSDGKYFIVRGRLWRKSNPALEPEVRERLVKQLMDARRMLRGQRPDDERADARRAVDEAKNGLGERGPVWWTDGAPDYNRHLVKDTPYAEWERLSSGRQ